MSDERDPVRDLLTRSVEPLPAPPGQYERVRQRALARRWRHATLPVVAAVAIAGTVAGIAVGLPSGSPRPAPLVVPAVTPTPSAIQTPAPTPTPTPAPSHPRTTPSSGSSSFTWSLDVSAAVGHPFRWTLSCPTRTFCAAVALLSAPDPSKPFTPEGLVQYQNGGWSAPTPMPAFEGRPTTVSCSDASFCMAASENGYFSRWDGSRWEAAAQMPTAGSAFTPTVDCVTQSFCMAVASSEAGPGYGVHGYSTWNGTAWSALHTVGDVELNAVSCPTSTYCIGIGQSRTGDVAMTWNGTRWSEQNPEIATGHGIGSLGTRLSCPTTSFCMAVEGSHASGDLYTLWDGSHWTPETRLATGLSSTGFGSVSCPTVSLCVATDLGSGVNSEPDTFKGPLIAVWRSGTWSQLQEAGDNREDSVSCADATHCLIVGGAGDKAAYLVGIAQ